MRIKWTNQVSGKAESNLTSHLFRDSNMAFELVRDTGMVLGTGVKCCLAQRSGGKFILKTKKNILAYGGARCRLLEPPGTSPTLRALAFSRVHYNTQDVVREFVNVLTEITSSC
jgi:hypothetical protein